MSDPAARRQPLWPALVQGAAGLLVLGVQPALYGAYVREGFVGEPRLGTLAAVEISAIAFGSIAGIALLRHRRSQIVGALGIALLALGNIVPLALALFLARTIAGFGAGMVVALAAAQIAVRKNVNAASGWFLFLQAASQYLVLQAISILAPTGTAATIQLALAVLALLSGPLLLLVPKQLGPADEELAGGLPPLAGWIGLIASGLFLGAAIGVWAYLGVWLEEVGMPPQDVSPRLTAALGGQIMGALCAVLLGMSRRSSLQVMVSGCVMIVAVACLLELGPGGLAGWALMIGFGFAWMVGTPALSGLLLELDPGRRSLPFGASAQLLGAAVIPTLAGELLAAHGLGLVLAASVMVAGLALVAVLIGIWASRARRGL